MGIHKRVERQTLLRPMRFFKIQVYIVHGPDLKLLASSLLLYTITYQSDKI